MTLKKSHIDMAERIAVSNFDKWNEVSGFAEPHSGYYSEILAVIEDAVHIGVQMALFGKVTFDENGDIKKQL